MRERSPIGVGVRHSDGIVIAPMAPAAFINPAVIQRTAALNEGDDPAAEPFRYREGMALGGPAATLPLRYAAAGVMSATQAGLAAATRANPQGATAHRRSDAQSHAGLGLWARPASGSSSGSGGCQSAR